MRGCLLVVMVAVSVPAVAADRVNRYFRKDGTYVAPHYRSEPNSRRYDNYSSQGNFNPYTGERGSQRNEFSAPPEYNRSRDNSQMYGYGSLYGSDDD